VTGAPAVPDVASRPRTAGDGETAAGRPAGGAPLFLVHDPAAPAEAVASLARALSGSVVALPVFDGTGPRLRTVEGIALRVVRRLLALQPRGPYRIAGWSLGAVVAWEAAGLLLGRDHVVEFLALVHPPTSLPDAAPADVLDALRRYVPPPLPLAVHLFTADAAGPWRGWGSAGPKAAARTVPLRSGASASPGADGEALAGALARELRRVDERRETGPEARHSPLFPLRFKGGGAPVYCIPGAGASVVGLAELAACLDPGHPVYGLEPRGMDGTSVPHATVDAAADHYLAEIGDAARAGPIHLVGHSFGGWVACEMALRLLAEGRPPASLSLIDSPVPDADDSIVHEADDVEAFLSFLEVLELAAERSFEIDPGPLAALDPASRLRLLHGRMVRFGLVPARSTPALLSGSFRVFSACLRTTWRPTARYARPARLVLLRDPRLDLEADPLRVARVARGWRAWLPHAQVSVGPGNHMTALKRPHVEQLAALLPLDA
jgi:thioesterase domain-containing protein